MAGKKGNTKAERLAATEAATKSGKEWARRFIELVRKNPKDYALQGWIQDAELFFKDKPDELNDFYVMIQRACMGETAPGRNDKAGCKTVDDAIFRVGLDLGALENLFECVNDQAQIIINDGDPDSVNYGLILEAIAEKGIREADAAMGRLHKGSKAQRAMSEASHG